MWLNTLLLALRSIRRNLMRSFLTVLGIVIGVSAVITMVTLGNGATQAIQSQIAGLGTNLLQVRPGQRMGPGGGGGGPSFEVADAEAIASQIGGVAVVAPESRTGATLVANGRNWSSLVTGSTNEWLQIGNWTIASGREFSSDEQRAAGGLGVQEVAHRGQRADQRRLLFAGQRQRHGHQSATDSRRRSCVIRNVDRVDSVSDRRATSCSSFAPHVTAGPARLR